MAREYTSEEILAMQKDAVRRVAQMRKLSQTRVQQQPAPAQKEKPSPEQQSDEAVPGLLDTLFSDSESLLILAVLFLLIREKADAKLILALFYLLL